MANKYYPSDSQPSKQSGGEGGPTKAQGSAPSFSMPIKTANWPGLPGKGGPDRSGGVATHGYVGNFYSLQQFSPKKMGKAMKGGIEDGMGEAGHMMPEIHEKMSKKHKM